jgi:hypothetical protein
MYMRERSDPARSFTTAPLLLGVSVAAILVIVQGVLASQVLDIVPSTLSVGLR